MSSSESLQLPKTGDRLLGRYTITDRISFGGFGAVYKALQDTLGREVAIKILLPEVFLSNRDYVEQFRQEALLTSQLRHPNTITVYDYGETESGLLFLVMEWLDGITLSEGLRMDGAFSYERCFRVAYQMLKSLTEAHEKGMVHRDLKPSNIMLCEQYGEKDVVKVLDFGLVKALEPTTLPQGVQAPDAPSFTQKRRAPGTPHYMAPEQATGKGTSPASDIYSLGLILHEMLTGKRAVDGPDKMTVLLKQARQPVPPLPTSMQSTFLGKVVAGAVHKDPKARPQNAGELLREFRRVEDTSGMEVESSALVTTEKWRQIAEARNVSSEIPSGPEREFLGREDVSEEFQTLLERSQRSGGGVVITLSGEAGIGKSALAERFAERFVEQLGGRVSTGISLPNDREGMTGFKRLVRELLNVRAKDLSAGRHEVRRGLEALGVSDFYLLNFLTDFIFQDSGGEETGRFERSQRLERFFGQVAESVPLMLVLENLNWSDAESLEFLWHMAASQTVRSAPLYIVATFRTKATLANRELQLMLERLNRLDHQCYREIRLGPLKRQACQQLMERAISMQRSMAKRCLRLTRGNPLFLETVIRYLADESAHLSVQGGAGAREPLSSSKLYLPTSMEKVFERRVAQVVRKFGQESFEGVLARAALVGESFEPEVLELALRKEGNYELVDRMTRALELWRREGVLRRPSDVAKVLEFSSPHLVEHFFAEASTREHLIAAQAKEEAYREGLVAKLDSVELSRHYKAAGQDDRAIAYMKSAAEDARSSNNLLRARELHQELIEMLDPGRGDHRTISKQSYLDLGELCLQLSELGPSNDYFEKALELGVSTADPLSEGLAYHGKAMLALARNEVDEADSFFLKARSTIPEAALIPFAKLLLGMGRVSRLKGDWEDAQARFDKAYELGSQERNYAVMAEALHALGSVAFELGNVRAAHERYEQSLGLFAHTYEYTLMADALLDRAHTSIFYRRMSEAKDSLEQALAIKQRRGDQAGAARGLLGLGRYFTCRMELEDGEKFALRALPVFKKLNERSGIAECQEVLAQARVLKGEFDHAASLFEQALELFEQIGGMRNQVFQMLHLGLVVMHQDKLDEAASWIGRALTLLDGHSSDAYRALALRLRGLWHELQGSLDDAERDLKQASDVASRSDQLVEQYLSRIALIKIAAFRQGGRWYAEELWGFVSTAKDYEMPEVRRHAALLLAWLEGVYGDRASWESAIAAVKELAAETHLSVAAFLAPFKLEVRAVQRHFPTEQARAYLQSADWVEQSLLN